MESRNIKAVDKAARHSLQRDIGTVLSNLRRIEFVLAPEMLEKIAFYLTVRRMNCKYFLFLASNMTCDGLFGFVWLKR